MKKLHISASWICPAIFIILVFLGAVTLIAVPDRDFSDSENRYLAKLPDFSFKALFNSEYTEDFEKYITDQFPARDFFVGVKAQTEYLIGKRDTNGVYFADDGYLINRYDETTTDTDRLHKNLGYISDFINRHKSDTDVNYYTMLVPSAQAILADKLPPFAPGIDQTAEYNKVAAATDGDGYIDLSEVFSAHKDEYIYYKTDHHWTADGVYYAYEAFCKAAQLDALAKSDFDIKTVSDEFYGTSYSKARLWTTTPDALKAYIPKTAHSYVLTMDGEKSRDSLYFEEYLGKRDKYSYYIGGNNPVVTIASGVGTNRRLLIIKDSYAHCFAPLAANHFDFVCLLDLRYYNGKIDDYIKENGITDVLILYGMETLQNDASPVKLG